MGHEVFESYAPRHLDCSCRPWVHTCRMGCCPAVWRHSRRYSLLYYSRIFRSYRVAGQLHAWLADRRSCPPKRVRLVHCYEFFALFSIFVAVSNLVPFRSGRGWESDGRRLLWLLTSKARTKRWICMLGLRKQLDSGVRARDLKRTWIVRACSCPDDSADALGAFWMAYIAAQDREETETAAENLERCLEGFGVASSEYKDLFLVEAAIFQAWNREDATATVWFDRIGPKKIGNPMNDIRLAICKHWVRRCPDEALHEWQEGLQLIEKLPAPPQAKKLVTDGWLEWRKEMDERLVRQCAATDNDRA